MMVFWIVVALLIGAALLFVVPPLLVRRSVPVDSHAQDRLDISLHKEYLAELENDLRIGVLSAEQYDQAKAELERRLLEDVSGDGEDNGKQVAVKQTGRGTAVFVAIAIPLLAVTLYIQLGNPDAMSPEARNASPENPHAQATPEQVMAMIHSLAQRLEKNPDDAEGWAILGRSYLALEQYPEASAALERATDLVQSDAQLYADYADAYAMAHGESLDGKPMQLIHKALDLDPDNHKALWLAGTAAYESGNYKDALLTWKRLQSLLPPDSPAQETMATNIKEVQSLIDGNAPPLMQANKDNGAVATATNISGTVSLDPSLQSRVAPDDVVFIFARAPSGPRMPLAALRIGVSELPYTFSLDDSQAVMPQRKISDFPEVIVGARISKSGAAMPASGDLQGSSDVVALGSRDVRIVIDTVVP